MARHRRVHRDVRVRRQAQAHLSWTGRAELRRDDHRVEDAFEQAHRATARTENVSAFPVINLNCFDVHGVIVVYEEIMH